MAKIRNKKTGQIIEVPDNQLPKYGISAPTSTPQPTQQSETNYGMAGSIGGGFAAPYPLSAATTAIGAYGGKRADQGRAPIPPTAGLMLLTSLLNPQRYEQLRQSEYSSEALAQEPEAIKFAIEQAGFDLAGGGVGKLLSKAGSKVMGPLAKLKINTPKGVIKQVDKLKNTIYPKVEEVLAKNVDKKISISPIFEKLDKLYKEYGITAKNLPKAQKKISDVGMRLLGKGSETDPLAAEALRKAFAEEVYGEAGKALTKRGGAGIAEKKAMQISGGALEKELKKIPEYKPLIEEYAKLAKVGKGMETPFKGGYMMGLLGGILAGVGFPQALPPLAAVSLSKMPYTNFLGKKLIGEGLNIAGKSASPLTKLIGDKSLNNGSW
jgi:hypothetical protein